MPRRELRRKAMGVRNLPQHLTITGALALALCLVALSGAAGSGRAYALGEAYKSGQVIVKLNPVIGATINEINADYGTTILDDSLGYKEIYLLKKPNNSETEQKFAERLTQDSENRVLYAEPNFVAEAPEDPGGDARHKAYAISDRRRSSGQYAAEYLNLSCAAGISRGGGVTVAVLDTGAQLDHPMLRTNLVGVKRYDFVGKDPRPAEVLDANRDGRRDRMAGHGTHVAAIVDQVAPAAKIMPLRVLNSYGYGDAFTIAKAILFAQRNGADVINLSLGTSKKSRLLKEMIEEANMKGIVVVAAAGNSNSETPHYPAAGNGTVASSEGLVAVTSVKPFVDEDGNEFEKKSWFANYGLWVDVAAPGEGIRSAYPVDRYANWSGTSMATPFISGQAALIRHVYPSLAPADVEAKILNSGQPLKSDLLSDGDLDDPESPSYTGKLGARHVDVCESLR